MNATRDALVDNLESASSVSRIENRSYFRARTAFDTVRPRAPTNAGERWFLVVGGCTALGVVLLAAFGFWAAAFPTAFADGPEMARMFEPFAVARLGGAEPLLLEFSLGEREAASFFNIWILHTGFPGEYV